MEFKDIFKSLRKEKDMSQEELGKSLNITRQAVSNYEMGKRVPNDYETLEEIADFFNVDIAYLMGKQNSKRIYDFSGAKSSLVSEDIGNYTDFRIIQKSNSIPLIGQIAAGTPILAEENIEQYFEIDPSVKADFALKIKGDSMIDAGIYDGDIAFIKKQCTLETGEIGAILIDDEATLKRFYKTDSSIVLQPENKEYQPIIKTEGDVHIAGKLVAVLNIVK